MNSWVKSTLDAEHLPWQQGVEVVGGGGVRAEWWRGDIGRCLGPVLAPVMSAVCAQAGRYGLSINHSTYRSRQPWRQWQWEVLWQWKRSNVSSYPFSWQELWHRQRSCSSPWWCREDSWSDWLWWQSDWLPRPPPADTQNQIHRHYTCPLTASLTLIGKPGLCVTSSGRLSTWPSGPVMPSSRIRLCSCNIHTKKHYDLK